MNTGLATDAFGDIPLGAGLGAELGARLGTGLAAGHSAAREQDGRKAGTGGSEAVACGDRSRDRGNIQYTLTGMGAGVGARLA